MNKVHLVGDIGNRFGHEWSMNVSDYGEIIRLIDCQREGFKKYLIESEENEIGFVIQRADEYINEESELLLNLNNEDIIITAVPLGAGKGGFLGTSFGKIILGVTLVLVGYYMPQILGFLGYRPMLYPKILTTIGGMLMTVGSSLAMEGVEQWLAGDPDAAKQKQGYLFDGGTNNIQQGQPVPLLYGELLIPGTPISATMTTTALNLTNLDFVRDVSGVNNSFRVFDYHVAQVKANTTGGYKRTGDGQTWDQTEIY